MQVDANGHGNSHHNGNGQSHPLDGVVGECLANSALMELQTGLFEMGRNRALMSGTTTPLDSDVNSLEEHARSMARRTFREGFDPAQYPHDKIRDEEYQDTLQQRAEIQQGERHARANLREANENLARTLKAGEKPIPNPWVVAAAIVAIAISVAPTFHDLFFHTLPDDVLAWLLSLIAAGFIGLLLALAILSGRRTVLHWVGVASGIGIGIALGAIRLSAAERGGECVFAIGLTLFESAAVLLLEWFASGVRDSEDKWMQAKKPEDEAMRLRDAAQAELARWLSRLEDINKAIRNHIAYVEDRANRNLQLPELETVAVKAALDGYNAGVTENVGRILGVRRSR